MQLRRALRRVPDKHLPLLVTISALSFVFSLLMISIGYLFLTGRLDMLEAMDETTKRKFLDGSSSSSSLSSSSFQRSSIGNAEEEEDLEENHHDHHLELAENPVHKEDGTYMRHAVDEDDDSHPHLTMNTNGMFFHPIVHTQSSYSTALENRNCKKTTSSSSTSGNGAWDHVPTSSLKQKQKEVFDRYALTGFRNKATTDARILMEFLLSISPKPQNGCCAIFDVGANVGKYVEELKSMPIAKDCEVHAFEPNPEVFKIMS